MATDAKLGLVVGLGVVLTVAVTYYPKAGPRRGTGALVPPRPAAARATSDVVSLVPAAAEDGAAHVDTH